MQMVSLKADLAGNLAVMEARMAADKEADATRRAKKGARRSGAKVAAEQVPVATLR